MIKRVFSFLCLISLFSCDKKYNELNERFENNDNEWVGTYYDFDELPFNHFINNDNLILESSSLEWGTVCYINYPIKQSKNFIIQAKIKVNNINENSYIFFEYGIDDLKNIYKQEDDTNFKVDLGDTKSFFGYYDNGEINIGENNLGVENLEFSKTDKNIINKGFNILTIKKVEDNISYLINDVEVYSSKYLKKKGESLGFNCSPYSIVTIDYLKIEYL